eukprot:COSAG01_NODE_16819_length_1200_cov_1.257713_2_plen_49_part_01
MALGGGVRVVQRPAAVATPPAAPSKPLVRRVAEAGGASTGGKELSCVVA